MMTFQGLPGAPDFPGSPPKLRSTSEVESEASMSETSSEDLVPPLEAEGAQERDEEEASKKKKPKSLANMFSIFTKGKKKRSPPSSAEPEGKPEPPPRRGGPLPTGRLGLHVGSGSHVRARRARAHGVAGPLTQHREGRDHGRGDFSPLGFHLNPLPNFGGGEEADQASVLSGTTTGLSGWSLAFWALSLRSCGRRAGSCPAAGGWR